MIGGNLPDNNYCFVCIPNQILHQVEKENPISFRLRDAISEPLCVARISGSLPTLPKIVALFIESMLSPFLMLVYYSV